MTSQKSSMTLKDKTKADTPNKSTVDTNSFLQECGTEIVNIYVGRKRRHFVFHKALLCDKVPFFQKMFNGGFKEAKDGVAYFPEDSEEAFDILSNWVYRNNVPPNKFLILCSSFYLAEKYHVPELMDRLMDAIGAMHTKTDTLPSAKSMRNAYNNTAKGSRLRLFMLRSVKFVLVQERQSYLDRWSTSNLVEAMSGCEDLMMNLVETLRGQNGKKQIHPCHFLKCDYHQHSSDEECPYKSTNPQ